MWQKTKNVYHLAQAIVAHVTSGYPARGVTFIGVTGTDGKTTTSSMIYHILQKSGRRVALVSTVAAIINGKSYDTGFHVTSPNIRDLLRYIRLAKKAKVEFIILEVTSQGLDQYRVFGIPFFIGVVTNITQDHFDYHKTYEMYLNAKYKLIRNASISILNRDDGSYASLKTKIDSEKQKKVVQKIISYGLDKNADINPHVFPFETKLIGDFNIYNCLAAVSACLCLQIDPVLIKNALLDFTPPVGRMEILYNGKYKVIIDFAHTPNALEQILSSVVKHFKPKGRVIHVFGSAGLRDKSKRPLMGKASSRYANISIITAEDPRTERIEDISEQIKSGMTGEHVNKKIEQIIEIPNREEAIKKAIALAKNGDIVIITGKGHEQSMNLGKGEEPWSDHEVVKHALEYAENVEKE